MLRYAVGVFLATLTSVATCVGGVFVLGAIVGDRPSNEDVAGFAVLASAFTALLAVVLYAPVLAYGRRRCWSRARSAAIAAGVLNLPIYVVLAAGTARGGLFGGASEAVLFACGFACAAAVFATVTARGESGKKPM
jgi:hypothetical protein